MIDWPPHKGSMTLTHNGHKNVYHSVEQSIAAKDFGMDCWVSEEQKQKAIENNDCWVLQWYPQSPVGFCVLAAADLDVLLNAAKGEN